MTVPRDGWNSKRNGSATARYYPWYNHRIMRAPLAALLLISPAVLAQRPPAKPQPVAWFSLHSSGNWVDESDPKNPRILKTGDPVYSTSKLVRREPKSPKDAAWLNLFDQSYAKFTCSEALVCDGPLDLSKVAQAAQPRLPLFQRIVNTMSGKRRPAQAVLQDAAVESGASLPAEAVISSAAKAAKYSFAWCFKALDQKCPDEPVPITVDWNPQRTASPIPLTGVQPGLHRLILLTQVEDEWFYTDQDAYVLVTGGKDAASRVAAASASLRDLRTETEAQPYSSEARARAVILLSLAERKGQ